jgi:hypothetical protein
MPSPRKSERDQPPAWLQKVDTDEMRALLKASTEFARTGYAPFLEKAKGQDGEEWAVIKAPVDEGFENAFFG